MPRSTRSNSALVMSCPLTRASTAGSCAGTGFGGSGAGAAASVPAAGAVFASVFRPSASSALFGDAALHPAKPTAAARASAGNRVGRDNWNSFYGLAYYVVFEVSQRWGMVARDGIEPPTLRFS